MNPRVFAGNSVGRKTVGVTLCDAMPFDFTSDSPSPLTLSFLAVGEEEGFYGPRLVNIFLALFRPSEKLRPSFIELIYFLLRSRGDFLIGSSVFFTQSPSLLASPTHLLAVVRSRVDSVTVNVGFPPAVPVPARLIAPFVLFPSADLADVVVEGGHISVSS